MEPKLYVYLTGERKDLCRLYLAGHGFDSEGENEVSGLAAGHELIKPDWINFLFDITCNTSLALLIIGNDYASGFEIEEQVDGLFGITFSRSSQNNQLQLRAVPCKWSSVDRQLDALINYVSAEKVKPASYSPRWS